MIADILTIEDVVSFFKSLVTEGVNAHPDEDFTQYINSKTGEDTYTSKDAAVRNNLMHKSFNICESVGIDIYDLMQEIYLKNTGLGLYMPLPSESADKPD
ncbi:hypothetical protein [Mucilaginibacter sp. UYCu711]|uniref:hypothetical protein n=1 Tax=Mucilaginibacter sp. UYCu711 TaxID=3156339 RepID=UPI003D2441D9